MTLMFCNEKFPGIIFIQKILFHSKEIFFFILHVIQSCCNFFSLSFVVEWRNDYCGKIIDVDCISSKYLHKWVIFFRFKEDFIPQCDKNVRVIHEMGFKDTFQRNVVFKFLFFVPWHKNIYTYFQGNLNAFLSSWCCLCKRHFILGKILCAIHSCFALSHIYLSYTHKYMQASFQYYENVYLKTGYHKEGTKRWKSQRGSRKRKKMKKHQRDESEFKWEYGKVIKWNIMWNK
jgi:hypothetical protein